MTHLGQIIGRIVAIVLFAACALVSLGFTLGVIGALTAPPVRGYARFFVIFVFVLILGWMFLPLLRFPR